MAKDEAKKGNGAVEGQTDEQATPATQEAPPAAPTVVLPEGVTQLELSEKDVEKLGQLDTIEKQFNMGCGQLFKGLAKLLQEDGRIEQMKNQLASEFKIRYEIPDNAAWQADFTSGKLYYRLAPKQEVPAAQ
jgi:hypothetical protein